MSITFPTPTVPLSPAAEGWLATLATPGVAVLDVAWETTVTPAKAHKGHVLIKQTTAKVMVGQAYRDMAEAREVFAERGEDGPRALKWGEWAVYPYIRTHVGKDGVRKFYARLNVIEGTVRTTYLIDGKIVKHDDFLAMLRPSDQKPSRPTAGTIDKDVESVTRL
jgi:hypothetical protein